MIYWIFSFKGKAKFGEISCLSKLSNPNPNILFIQYVINL